MKDFYYNYKYIIVGVSVWISIQFFKFLYDSIANKKLMFSRFWGSGGMPSSHSAVVTSLATMIEKNTTNYEKFQELTGHTVIQVIAGFVIGLVVGIIA